MLLQQQKQQKVVIR